MDWKIKNWWYDIRSNYKAILVAIALFLVALMIYAAAGDYVTDVKNTVSSSDLILDHFGPYNLNFIFVWLFLAFDVVFFAYPLFIKPRLFPYAINFFSLLLVIRSGFVTLTHLRPPADAVRIVFPAFLQTINFSNDLFFSGHVSLAFLGFLVFRKYNKLVSYFMLACSIILGVVVLAMHVHYSIDVISAYFITFCVYEVGNKFVNYLDSY